MPDTGPSTDSSVADTSGTSESSPGSSSTAGLTRQQIRPPLRPTAVLQAAITQPSQTAHQAPHCLQDRPVHHVLRKLCQPRFQADHLHHLWQIAPGSEANPKRPSQTCPHTFPIPEADECSKAKGNCIEASCTARYQPVAIAKARRAPTRTIRGIQWCQSLCSRQAKGQYSNIQ